MELDNIKMWESILKELWHWPQKEALVLCIKNALRDQGLKYNSDTKKIESIKPETLRFEKGKWYVKTCHTYDGYLRHFKEGCVYQAIDEVTITDGYHHASLNSWQVPRYFRLATPEEIPHEDEQKPNPVLDIEIPFGAKDSELQEASYYIPEGFHAEIEGNRVVIKRGEQKPVIEIKSAEESLGIDSDTYNKIVDECIFGEQKPAEWSEEDESHIRFLIECLEHCKKGVALTMSTSTAQEYIDWLKSLRPQSQWRPSEEQIETLEKVIGYSAFPDAKYCVELKRLLEQLKAL